MGNLLGELRLAVRSLSKRRGFALLALVTLAIGIGAITAIFSVLNAVILRPLPYDRPHEIVMVQAKRIDSNSSESVSTDDFADWQKLNRSFSRLSAFTYWTFNLTNSGEPVRILGVRASASFFPLMGVQPELGRVFSQEEDRAGAVEVAVISHSLWVSRFGADRSVVGRVVQLNSLPTTILGVMPASFQFPADDTHVWAPLAGQMDGMGRAGRALTAVARLRDGTSVDEGRRDMERVTAILAADYPSTNKGWGAKVVPLIERVTGESRPALLLVFGAVSLVFLIGCVNVASLLLARASERRGELAIRCALGANRVSLMRHVFGETIVLAASTAFECAIAFLACSVPAWRSTKVDPLIVLK